MAQPGRRLRAETVVRAAGEGKNPLFEESRGFLRFFAWVSA